MTYRKVLPLGRTLIHKFQFPLAEEELKQDGNGNDDSEGEQSSFMDTDVCKSLDDHLNLITNNLPEFTSSLAPRRHRGSPFSNKQAPDLSQGK